MTKAGRSTAVRTPSEDILSKKHRLLMVVHEQITIPLHREVFGLLCTSELCFHDGDIQPPLFPFQLLCSCEAPP